MICGPCRRHKHCGKDPCCPKRQLPCWQWVLAVNDWPLGREPYDISPEEARTWKP